METMDAETNREIDESYLINQLFIVNDENIFNPLWYQTITSPKINIPYLQSQQFNFRDYFTS